MFQISALLYARSALQALTSQFEDPVNTSTSFSLGLLDNQPKSYYTATLLSSLYLATAAHELALHTSKTYSNHSLAAPLPFSLYFSPYDQVYNQ